MIRIYLRLAIPLLAIFIALNIAARAIGSTQPPNPALRGFTEGCEGKPQPCWYGIVPDQTKTWEAREIFTLLHYQINDVSSGAMTQLQVAGDSIHCMALLNYREDVVYSLGFSQCENLQVSDLIYLFGMPNGFCRYYKTGYIILFQDGYVSALLKNNNQIYPHSRILTLAFTDNPVRISMVWRGFLTFGIYNRIYPQAETCYQ